MPRLIKDFQALVVKVKAVVKVKVAVKDRVRGKAIRAATREIKAVVEVEEVDLEVAVAFAERTAAHLIHACRQDNFHAVKAITARAIL